MRVHRLACVAVAGVMTLLSLMPPALAMPGAAAAARTGGLVSGERIITTLYAYPGSQAWGQVTGNAPAIRAAIVDMCAADGSGSGCDGTPWHERPPPAWTAQIDALRGAGITPLVYIATDYGDAADSPAFSLDTVESEVAAAVGWYGGGIGFMFDQAGTSCALEASYYGPLYDYVKSVTADGPVELSPGTVNAGMSCYMNATDILQVFEGPQASDPLFGLHGFQRHWFPRWMRAYPASRFAATVSQGTASRVGTDVAVAAADRIGNIYVDDEPEPGPSYQTLPAFWPAEVAAVLGEAGPPGAEAPGITGLRGAGPAPASHNAPRKLQGMVSHRQSAIAAR